MQYSPLREAWKSYLHFAHTSNKLWKRLKTHHLYYFWLLRKLDWNITNCINPSAKNSTEIKKGVTKLRHGILSTLSTTAQIYHLTKDISIALMTAGVTTALAIPNLFSTSHIIWAKQSLINCSQSSKITQLIQYLRLIPGHNNNAAKVSTVVCGHSFQKRNSMDAHLKKWQLFWLFWHISAV